MATDTLTHATAHAHEHGHHDAGGTKIFGFWIYLMSDCILFSILFATYAVLVNGTAGGPTGKDIFELPFVLVETFLLQKQQKPGYLLAGVDLVVWCRIYRDGNLRIPSPDC